MQFKLKDSQILKKMAVLYEVPTGHKSPTIFISNIVLIITVIMVSPFTFFTHHVTIGIIEGILISCLTVHMSS